VTDALHKDAHIIEQGSIALAEMRDVTPSLLYAALVTDDGFEVARVPDQYAQGSRFASMSSSVQALSEAVARELNLGASSYVAIASESGHVIQLRVPGQALVLAGVFDTAETLGKALSVSRRAAERMAARMAERPIALPVETL
jgi:predicted regulator of Ras-like GTPase activity (Roadblock/LC7/MglB family)